MNRNWSVMVFSLPIIGVALASAPAWPQAEQRGEAQAESGQPCTSKVEVACEQLRMGIKAYRQAQFVEAATHYRNAAQLDSQFVDARVYLGVALAQQYVPGGESPDNLRLAHEAIGAFEEALKLDAKNQTALTNLGQIWYYLKEFKKCKEIQLRLVELDPADPQPYYWIGVLAWYQCYPRRMNLRKELKLYVPRDSKDPDTLPPLPEEARVRLASENGALVEEGMQSLEKAIELRPNDFSTMAYLNLLYREKADLEGDENARQDDLRTADGWVEKALAKRRQQDPPPSDPEEPK